MPQQLAARHLEPAGGHLRRLAQPIRHDPVSEREPGGAGRIGRAQPDADSTAPSKPKSRIVLGRSLAGGAISEFRILPSRGQRGRSPPAERLARHRRCSCLSHRRAHVRPLAPTCSTGSSPGPYEPYRTLAAEQHRLNLDLRAIAQPRLRHAGHGRAHRPEAVRLHSLSRRLRPEARPRGRQHARHPAAHGVRPAAQPAGLRPLALHRRSAAHRARGRQSHVAGDFRRRHRQDRRRFRQPGRAALAPATARLAGGRFPRERLGRQALLPPGADFRDLSADGARHTRQARQRSRESPAQPRTALPHGCRNAPRLRAGGQRPARAADRRPQREALPARRHLGSGRHVRLQHALLQARHGRRTLSPLALHASGNARAARVAWTFSTPPRANRAWCGASAPIRRCRRWPP